MKGRLKIGLGLLFGLSGIGLKYVMSSSDADKWIHIASQNAHHQLDAFNPIASSLASGSRDYTALHDQLVFLQEPQINEAAANNRELIPKIMGLVTRIQGLVGSEGDPPPSFTSKLALKALIWFIDGIRDNKSYYLLDGASQWVTLRLKILQGFSGPQITTLSQQLGAIQNKTEGVRDQLDGLAQIYVAAVKKIHALDGDIGQNLEEIREAAEGLVVVSEQREDFLNNTKELEEQMEELVGKYADAEVKS